jgi:hypothetical protein
MSDSDKVDIFKAFDRLSALDLNFWDSLTDGQRKQISPYVFTLWMKSTPSDAQILYLNEFINPHLFTSLKNNEDIAFMLLALSTRGHKHRYSWKAAHSAKKGKSKKEGVKNVLKEYFQESERNIQYYLDRLTLDEFLEICDALGIQDDEKKKLKKEFEKA